jgi:hypothetical protein
MTSERAAIIDAMLYPSLTLSDAVNDTRKGKDMTMTELKSALAVLRDNKMWGGRYFAIDTEVQRRAVRDWRNEDVFGQGK